METSSTIEFTRPLRLKDLKKRVTQFELEATPQECAALAVRFGLPEIAVLTAQVSVTRMAKDTAVRIEGTISSRLSYLSVVSLEPFEAEIAEDFSEVLTEDLGGSGETEVDVPPEEENMGLIEDGGFDLGEVISQNLALLLEEHPRKPGEENSQDGVVWVDGNAGDEKVNPFSVLAEMRDRLRDGD